MRAATLSLILTAMLIRGAAADVRVAPPTVTSVQSPTVRTLDVTFDQSVTVATATDLNNYALQSFGTITSAAMTGPASVHLMADPGASPGDPDTLIVFGVRSLESNLPMTVPMSTGFIWGYAPSPPSVPTGRTESMILFDDVGRDHARIRALRSAIEATGGRVRAVLGLAAIVADVEPGSVPDLAGMPGVQGVYDSTIVVPPFSDGPTLGAVAAWNRLLGPPPPPAPYHVGQPPTDEFQAPDLPAVTSPRSPGEAEYENRPPGFGAKPDAVNSGFFDTSLYLAGDIAVGIFFSNAGWTPASATSSFAEIVYTLDHLLSIGTNARIVFTYVDEVDNAGNPNTYPSDERQYDNDLRGAWEADWAYIIDVRRDGTWPNAFLHGPRLQLDVSWWPYWPVAAHETGHIFGAGDEYCPNIPSSRRGYLHAAHFNACGNDGTGYFSGAGDNLPDLMSGWEPCYSYNWFISPSTAGEFGWYDHNGNGVLDVMETQPVIDGPSVGHSATNPPVYGGIAYDRALLNEAGAPYGDVSINRITGVQYRINGLAWQEASAADLAFDSASEGFQFTPPALPNGTYQVTIRATNSIGKSTVLPFSQSLVISGSSTTNTRPFAVLAVTPTRARFGTTVSAKGSASRDLETPAAQLEYSWNWGEGSGPTSFSLAPSASHVYVLPGTYVVQLRVRDAGGLITSVTRTVVAESYDTSPVVAFRATPENRHLTSGPSYAVFLNVVGSSDGETPYSELETQWDADGDGTYEIPWSSQKVLPVTLAGLQIQQAADNCVVGIVYPRSEHRIARVQVKDAHGNITTAERAIWVVPYNHRPTVPYIGGLTFAPVGSGVDATAHASDADLSTTWDGVLEYRWDFEGDGSWDTRFEPSATITLPAGTSTASVVAEIQDRFEARVRTSLWQLQSSSDNLVNIPLLASNLLQFEIENTGDASGHLAYSISVLGSNQVPDSAVVRLNGLPPGTPVEGAIDLPLGQTSTLEVQVELLSATPAGPVTLVIRGDRDHDGQVTEVLLSHEMFSEGTFVAAVPRDGEHVSLALEGALPNPSVGQARVWFTLPGREPASLEVLDVAGRRLLHEDVGGQGPGRHSVDVGAAIRRPGLYFLRLEQGGRTLRGKMAVVR